MRAYTCEIPRVEHKLQARAHLLSYPRKFFAQEINDAKLLRWQIDHLHEMSHAERKLQACAYKSSFLSLHYKVYSVDLFFKTPCSKDTNSNKQKLVQIIKN